VGMDEIGAAAGTSGPTVYRHFRNKQELLITSYRRTGHRIASQVAQAVDAAASPEQALRALIDCYADVALANEDLLVVYLREARSLPPDAREEMAAIQNELIDTWSRVLAHERDGLGAAEARFAALATIGALNAALPEQEVMEVGPRRAWSTTAALAASAAARPAS
jgi:AcrR family transcriptional regulator